MVGSTVLLCWQSPEISSLKYGWVVITSSWKHTVPPSPWSAYWELFVNKFIGCKQCLISPWGSQSNRLSPWWKTEHSQWQENNLSCIWANTNSQQKKNAGTKHLRPHVWSIPAPGTDTSPQISWFGPCSKQQNARFETGACKSIYFSVNTDNFRTWWRWVHFYSEPKRLIHS